MEMEPTIIDMNKNNFKEEEEDLGSYAAKLPYVFFSFDLNLNLDLITHAPSKNPSFLSISPISLSISHQLSCCRFRLSL